VAEPNGRITVLIAEDEPAMRAALSDLIEIEDELELVGAAADAQEAIDLAREHRPDVALVDVKMPAGGGTRAAREIRDLSPATRVVALSAYGDRTTVLEMLRAGAVGYLVKGTSAGEIVEAIRRSVRGQASLSTEVTAEVIHELVELLNRSERMTRELHDLDRTKSELIQVLSHELMTPITVIRGAAGTISGLGDDLSREDARELASSVSRAADRLRRLVGNLAATARLDREEAEVTTRPIDAAEIIALATAEFPERGSRLRHPAPGASLELWGDLQLASQALVVLLENALEHSPPEEPVDVLVEGTGVEVQVQVADRGPGIDPEVAGRIFAAFTQADASVTRPHEGLGIGLYLARKIMAAHEGRIEFESREGGGTTFTLSFPQAAPGAPGPVSERLRGLAITDIDLP
jgi:two-component system sensor histidine kinase KdpD